MQPSTLNRDAGGMDLVIFRLDRDRYAVPLVDARRILHAVAVTRLPGAPPVVEGVVSVHGVLTPVFDLRRRFGLPEREMQPEDHMILVEAAGRAALLHVDGVEEVAAVEAESIVDPERVVAGTESLSGVGRLPDGLVLIHDLARFLSEAEADRLDEALSANEADGGGP